MAQSVSTVEQQVPQTQSPQPSQPQSQRPAQPHESHHSPEHRHAERGTPRPVYTPPADIYETGEALIVMCELPGVGSDGVDITLERRVLTIRGRAADQQHTGYQRVYAEYSDGDYERVFTLSEDIDRDRIEATARDGVLHLVLPKAAPVKARKIELKAG